MQPYDTVLFYTVELCGPSSVGLFHLTGNFLSATEGTACLKLDSLL